MTQINEMKPSDVSTLVTGQHRAAGTMLTELARASETLQTGGPAAHRHTVELGLTLCDVLLDHILSETEILAPALRDADAWGPCRCDDLLHRLLTRRQKIDDLRESCERAGGETLHGAIDQFIDDRRSAMGRAEVRDLSALRDDVIGIDCDAG